MGSEDQIARGWHVSRNGPRPHGSNRTPTGLVQAHQFQDDDDDNNDTDDVENIVHGFFSSLILMRFSTSRTPGTFLVMSPARSFWSRVSANPLSWITPR